VETTIGALPYLARWDNLLVLHPVFNLSEHKLFEFTRTEWNRLAKKAVDEEISEKESNILKVTYLAVLHTFGKIHQDQPCLPPLATVQSTLNKILSLAIWKYTLDSPRFRFPEYVISAKNSNLHLDNVDGYLEACFAAKKSYETQVQEINEAANIRAAKAAMDALTKEWATPVSKKILWSWVKHYIQGKYPADAAGWIHTLFLGGGNAIIEFQQEDIEMMEDIIMGECPAGTGVMRAVRGRIDTIWNTWKAHHRVFEIDLADYAENQGTLVNGKQVAMPNPGPKPTLKDCEGNKIRLTIATAKWTIANAAWVAQNRQSDDPRINDQLGEI